MDLFTKAKNMGVKSVKCLVIRQNGVQEKNKSTNYNKIRATKLEESTTLNHHSVR